LDVRSSQKKVGHRRPRIVQILLENYPDTSSNVCIALETRQVGTCLLGVTSKAIMDN